MEIISTIWEVIKVLLIAITAMGLITAIIAALHPLRFDLKLRSSIRGQRGEIWFVYLFRLVKIGVVATPHTQDVVLKILFWKKILDRQQRTRPPAQTPPPTTPDPSEPPPTDSSSATTAATVAESSPIPKGTPEAADVSAATLHEQPESEKVSEETLTATSSCHPATPDDPEINDSPSLPADVSPAATTTEKSDEQASIKEFDNIEDIEPVTPTEVNTAPLKPLDQVEHEQKQIKTGTEPDPESAKTEFSAKTNDSNDSSKGWRLKLRKFKKDFSRRYRQIQGYLRLFRIKYRVLFPVVKRFFHRGRAAFSLHNPALMLRYSLHEHYLTGMMQGNLAIAAGMAGKFGVNFVPIPVFSQPGIYAKGGASAVIRPWRLMFAAIGLLFEFCLYKELYQAFKWYRNRKRQN